MPALAMIQLNVISVVHLTKLFASEMVARGSGRILSYVVYRGADSLAQIERLLGDEGLRIRVRRGTRQ
jgi:hypothetical protein